MNHPIDAVNQWAIARNHTGHRVGQYHQKARLSDEQVRQMRHDREREGMSYAKLAKKYGCGVSTARDIVNYWTRASA